jgi:hypothetical protein
MELLREMELKNTNVADANPSRKETRSPTGRVRYIISVPNRTGRSEEKPGLWPPEETYATTANCAMTVKEIKTSPRKLGHFELTIEDPKLRNMVRKTLGSWTKHMGYHWNQHSPVIKENDATLIHNWEKLQEAARTNDGGDGETENPSRADLRELLEHFEKISLQQLKLRNTMMEDKKVTWEGLTWLFKPGTEIVIPQAFFEEPQLFIVEHNFHRSREETLTERLFVVSFWGYDWNGSKLVRQKYVRSIGHFEKEQSVIQLPFFPIEYWPEDELRKNLIERGEQFWKVCGKDVKGENAASRVHTYDGTLMMPKDKEETGSLRPSRDRETGWRKMQTVSDPIALEKRVTKRQRRGKT